MWRNFSFPCIPCISPHVEKFWEIWRNFATIYVLSCGEKLSPKIHLWRKNDKYELWRALTLAGHFILLVIVIFGSSFALLYCNTSACCSSLKIPPFSSGDHLLLFGILKVFVQDLLMMSKLVLLVLLMSMMMVLLLFLLLLS